MQSANLLAGTPSCAQLTLPDGTTRPQMPSTVCYVWAGLIAFSAAVTLQYAGRWPVAAISQSAFSMALAYLMYKHCNNCQAWRGFFVTIILSTIVGSLVAALFPHASRDLPPA